MTLRHIFHRILLAADWGMDATWRIVRIARNSKLPAQIVPYRSYGTEENLVVRGRVLTNRPLRPSATDSSWRNAVHMLQRWASREVPGVEVQARYGDKEKLAVTNDEGFFQIEVPREPGSRQDSPWHDVTLELREYPVMPGTSAIAKVLVPPEEAEYGVISDIDDTIIFSSATNYLRMAKIVLLGNAFSRLPFKGVAALYRGLEKGTKGCPVNPFFFVSSSPWNLYDVLRDLFEYRSIPAGPLILQDYGIDRETLVSRDHHAHKSKAIHDILSMYPKLKFVLIGDSGQADPEIYREIVREYPGRILSVYIRDVSREPERDEAVRKLGAEIQPLECDLVLAEETLIVAQHALAKGWITADVLSEIEQEKTAEPPPRPIEKLLQQQT